MEAYAYPDAIVSTDDVVEIIGDTEHYRIIEADENPLLYAAGHIPGAVQVDWITNFLHPVMRDLITPTDFARLCSALGITPDMTVIFYGDQSNWWACHALWVFNYFGHTHCRIMDGGRTKWFNEGKPISWEVPTYPQTDYPTPSFNGAIRAYRDDVIAHIKRGGKIIDVRSKAEYDGLITHPADYPTEAAIRAGHIPGAVNIPWSTAVSSDGTFKTAKELEKIYCADTGFNTNDDIIVYCRIGERSSHTWFVLTYLLGFKNVRNYDGSWTEWGNSVAVPIERTIE